MKSFVWREPYEDYNGEARERVVTARLGDEVDLPEAVARYGDDLGAFVTDDEKVEEDETVESLADMDHEELTNWVSEHTIPQILKAAKADTDLIKELLDAENAATGNDPRTGLVDGLAHIAGEGEAPEPPADSGEETNEVEAEQEEGVDEVAQRLGVDLSKVDGSGDEGEVTADDVKEFFDDELASATDSAVELADEEDLYLADIFPGSGKDGRITKDDVQKYIDDSKSSGEDNQA